MKVYELLNENSPWRTDTTEMPFYDNMMENPEYFAREKGIQAKVVKMSPSEYISTVMREKNVTRDDITSSRDPKTISKYARLMTSGTKFPITTLDYSKGFLSQEGLHRALAAEEAGITEMPVLVVDLTDEEKEYIRKNK
jgi:hypothetical protein